MQTPREAELTLSGVLNLGAVDSSRIPLTSALQLSLQVVRLVAEAHDRGQVVGVLDAGHLIVSAKGGLSLGGSAKGNPIAPELKRGEMPDRLTDVYALGALMYRLLTGRRLEQTRIIEPPSHFNPAVDTTLDDLVLSALDEDPSERPYSARDLEQRLLGVYDELGLPAESKTEATKLISERYKVKKPAKPVSDAAPRKLVAYVPPKLIDPDGTMDNETPDDDDDWQPQLDRNPLEKKWLLGGIALVALVLIAFIAWPAGSKKETPRAVEDDTPVQVAKPEPKIEARLVEPAAATPEKATAAKKKTVESPKKSTRRARR